MVVIAVFWSVLFFFFAERVASRASYTICSSRYFALFTAVSWHIYVSYFKLCYDNCSWILKKTFCLSLCNFFAISVVILKSTVDPILVIVFIFYLFFLFHFLNRVGLDSLNQWVYYSHWKLALNQRHLTVWVLILEDSTTMEKGFWHCIQSCGSLVFIWCLSKEINARIFSGLS